MWEKGYEKVLERERERESKSVKACISVKVWFCECVWQNLREKTIVNRVYPLRKRERERERENAHSLVLKSRKTRCAQFRLPPSLSLCFPLSLSFYLSNSFPPSLSLSFPFSLSFFLSFSLSITLFPFVDVSEELLSRFKFRFQRNSASLQSYSLVKRLAGQGSML